MSRVLVKLSGEVLGTRASSGSGETTPKGVLDADMLDAQAAEIAETVRGGIQIALVIGGGNIVRGNELESLNLHRVTADHMGMLATVINALAFRDAVERHGIPAEVLCSHPIPSVAEGYSARRARALLNEGRVVLLAGGTGNPLFTTDTAACLRGIEIDADLVVKATKVDGVYSANPATDPEAKRFDELTFDEVISLNLKVMDIPAISLCRDHGLPIAVCDMTVPGTLTKVMHGAKVGTRIGV